MTKKKLLKLIAAGVALVLLLVFVPFPLPVSRTYYGYIHQGENAGKDVTAQLKGWRFYYLFAEEEWRGLKLKVTADDGTELDPTDYQLDSGSERRSLFTDKKQYYSGVGGYYRATNGMRFSTIVYLPSLRELALYEWSNGVSTTLITLSTDKDKTDADVLRQFQEHLEAHNFVF